MAGSPRPIGHRLRRRAPGVASAALVAVVLVILFGPVLMLALFSFNDSSIISLPWEGFTTHWYADAWANEQAKDAIVNSLVIASIVTVISLALGTAAAWGLTRLRFFARGPIAGLHGSVLVVPWLIIGVAGLIFFSEAGIALSLQTIGIMHVVTTFPLVVAIVAAGLVRFQRSLEEAAIDLGASQLQMLRYVVLPQIAPSLAAAGDLRLRLVVQQLRDLVLRRRLRPDVPRLGLLDPAPVGEPAAGQRRLDRDRARPGRRRVRRLAADQGALAPRAATTRAELTDLVAGAVR